MASTIVLTPTLLEGTTAFYSFELTDAFDAPIGAFWTNSLTLTVLDLATGAVVNGREAQNALNANDVTLVTETTPTLVSTVTWAIQPEDTVRVEARREVEHHIALFEWRWDSGNQRQAHKVQFSIEAVRYVLADF